MGIFVKGTWSGWGQGLKKVIKQNQAEGMTKNTHFLPLLIHFDHFKGEEIGGKSKINFI